MNRVRIMKSAFDLVVVIPVGPGSGPESLLDTIASVRHFTSGTVKFILADDSQKGTGAAIQTGARDIDVLVMPKNLGKVGGLYISLSKAFRHALTHYECELVLRMDDDALMIGPDPHLEAIEAIRAEPRIGIIGRHIKRRFSPDCFGNIHDNYWPRKQLIKDTATWKIIRRPIANLALRNLMMQALSYGYELGENIQGGAYFITRTCLQKLDDAGLLPLARLKRVNLCEDHLFSLLAKVIDMDLHDLSGAGMPFGIAWKGLPASPEVLVQAGKKIIHSLRYWANMDEAAIRMQFRKQREAQTLQS
jgi:glycosyltransferase involved in cell wall biosynthesis